VKKIMPKTIVLIAFFLLALSNSSTAQSVGLSLDKLKTAAHLATAPPQYVPVFLRRNALQIIENQPVSIKKPTRIPSVFSVEALPFFCKIEYKMGLNKKLPVKFRLGDVQYVDELEGKH
jgi:hypothetical protein